MITFFLGVIASLLATAIWYLLAVLVEYRKITHLVGYWIQSIPNFEGQTAYSIGRFTYNRSSRTFHWDGTNYSDDGKPNCEWGSIHLHFDLPARKILYIYRGNKHSQPFLQFYGFGVMNLKDDENGRLAPTTGHFQDAQEVAMPQHFTMCRLDQLAARLGLKQGLRPKQDFFIDLIQRHHAMNTAITSITRPDN